MKKINFKKIAYFGCGVVVFCLVSFIFVWVIFGNSLPDVEDFDNAVIVQSVSIYDRTGEVMLYNNTASENRHIVSLDEIPDIVVKSTLAAEDHNFYSHGPISIPGILRSFIANLKSGSLAQGGSTLTMQLARNAFLSNEKKYERKLKEIILAFRLEGFYSKDDILEMYLNQVPYGYNAYGVESGSRLYFNKPVTDLSLTEAVYLASILNAPSYLSPYGNHRDDLEARKEYVLKKMYKLGWISEKELEDSLEEEVVFVPKNVSMIAPHFVAYIQQLLVEKYGKDRVESGGLKVISTLDIDLQRMAEKAVLEHSVLNEEKFGVKNMALLSQDPKTGQILAMVGSKDFFDLEDEGNFNAVFGLRQPGSSFKPFAYVKAFEKGYTPDTVVFDLQTNFSNNSDPYVPVNYDHEYIGPVNLRNALAQSRNVPAVKTLYLAGLDNVINFAKECGVTTLTEKPSYYGLPLVLGGGAVNLYEMVGAYSVFAQDGVYHEQSPILKVIDYDGTVLYEYEDSYTEVIDSNYVRMLNDVLSDNVARTPLYGTYYNPMFFGNNIPVAAKTGTSQDYRDAWIFGYTPNLVTGVWVGNNDYSPIKKEGSGGMVAAPVWHDFMEQAIVKMGIEYFFPPVIPKISKPMLNGEYVTQIDDTVQIHSILYYVDKNNPLGRIPKYPSFDSQFDNWEETVVNWANKMFVGFDGKLNAEFNSDIYAVSFKEEGEAGEAMQMEFVSPVNGGNFSANLEVKVIGDYLVKKEVYLNDMYLGELNFIENVNGYKIYKYMLPTEGISGACVIKVRLVNKNGDVLEKYINVYR